MCPVYDMNACTKEGHGCTLIPPSLLTQKGWRALALPHLNSKCYNCKLLARLAKKPAVQCLPRLNCSDGCKKKL